MVILGALLQAGNHSLAQAESSFTPLHLAGQLGRSQLIPMLLNAGCASVVVPACRSFPRALLCCRCPVLQRYWIGRLLHHTKSSSKPTTRQSLPRVIGRTLMMAFDAGVPGTCEPGRCIAGSQRTPRQLTGGRPCTAQLWAQGRACRWRGRPTRAPGAATLRLSSFWTLAALTVPWTTTAAVRCTMLLVSLPWLFPPWRWRPPVQMGMPAGSRCQLLAWVDCLLSPLCCCREDTVRS